MRVSDEALTGFPHDQLASAMRRRGTVVDRSERTRLTSGLQLLELWATVASQLERNQVYDMLFAVADGSVFWRYPVLRGGVRWDGTNLREGELTTDLFIVVRDDLIIKIDLESEVFGILYIGPRDGAPGLDAAVEPS